ncbi:MAG: T9SS type A sorting domain-containing protein [candidate division WOR-3 bacterium]
MMELLLLTFIPEIEANPYAMGGHWWFADSARSTGAKWVRMWRADGGAEWGKIQPTSLDSFVWDEQDRWIRWADSSGFNIMLTVVSGGPEWQSVSPCKWIDTTHIPEVDSLGWNWGKASYPPQDYDAWYNFIYELVSRYDGNTPDPKRPGQFLPEVRYWEVVPEPDCWGYWYGTKETYFDMFVPTFVRAVRDANPNAVVVGPSLTGYSLAWAVVREMVDSGVDTSIIVNFYRSHKEYEPDDVWGWYHWNNISDSLENNYQVRWRIQFVQYSFHDSTLYDKRGFHDYESWKTSPILIDYERRWMAQYGYSRPHWWTELGHCDDRQWKNIPEPEHAARTWKKMINAFSAGVEWMCYSPMFQPDLILPLYYHLNDDGDPWTPDTVGRPLEAKHSFAFIAGKINEQTGFKFARSDTISHSYLFWFTSDSMPSYTLMSAWADSGIVDTIKVQVPPGTQSATLYDYLGNPTNISFSDSVELILTWQPIMVEFYHTVGAVESKPGGRLSISLAPNPGKEGIGIIMNISETSDIILKLYDPTGRVVSVREMGKMGPGEHQVFLPARPGVYFLELRAGRLRRVLKAVVGF